MVRRPPKSKRTHKLFPYRRLFRSEATPDEIAEMAEIVSEAMAAGAAGFSSTHSPTHLDSADRPVPSRLSSLDELKALVEAAGRGGGGPIAYLPGSAVEIGRAHV